MKFECFARRPGGTTVNVGGTDYRFAPDERGRHVAEVTDQSHIRVFASIEGYRVVPDSAPPAPQPAAEEATMSTADDRFVAAVQAHKDTIQKLLDENKSLSDQLAAARDDAVGAEAYKDQVSAFLESETAQINAALTPAPAAAQDAQAATDAAPAAN